MPATVEPKKSKSEKTADEVISSDCRDTLRALIDDHAGCEVFSIGTVNERGLIEELDPVAFGNWKAVPAPAQDARSGQVLIHNHPSGGLDPSDADIQVASLYGSAGIGFYIIDNAVERVRVVVQPFKPKPEVLLDAPALLAPFQPGGAVARAFSNYEFREQQIHMMELLVRAFNDRRIAVVEAGTGTGKSFAYLAPSIQWALANKKKVVISTNTINLQEQLIAKDIPELAKLLGVTVKAVLVKGRGNYVSQRRLGLALRQLDLVPSAKNTQLQQIAEWAGKTSDGSRAELNFELGDDAWEAAVSDKDDCMRARCPNYNECFFYKARREASAADILVANHHIVMADIALKKDSAADTFAGILPPYDRVIFDEAHHVEEVATEYFSTETSHLAIRRQLSKLTSTRSNRGALDGLSTAIIAAKAATSEPATAHILKLLNDVIPLARSEADFAAEQILDDVFYSTLRYFNAENMERRERRQLRVTSTVMESEFWREVTEKLSTLVGSLETLSGHIAKAMNMLKTYPAELLLEMENSRLAVSSAHRKLMEHCAALGFFLKAPEERNCRWFEVGYLRDRPVIRPCTAPLDIAPQLQSALFAKRKTVVLTSATLTVENKFTFLAKQIGLAPTPPDEVTSKTEQDALQLRLAEQLHARTDFLQLGTPFDYAKHCVIGVTLDTASPTDTGFESSIKNVVLEAIKITRGRAFVLFTSYRSLQQVYDGISRTLIAEGITPLRQGEMPRSKLLEVFRGSTNAALFATSSFWEGVDVQGEALQSLILTRLPFRVPTTPILEARTERMQRQGRDPFRELTIPLAVIKFKQGFGRLIRSKTDRGVVLILDNRVATKNYGKTFLRSLPPAQLVCDKQAVVLDTFRKFFA